MNIHSIKIGSKEINKDSLYFIVEEGQANWGDFDKALKMVDIASETGANAIEFQFAIADDFYINTHPYKDVYAKTQLGVDQMIEVVKYTKSLGLEFITVPLSHNLIEPMVKAGTSAFNINASDINNHQIIDEVAKTGLPFFISLPLASEEEIKWAVDRASLINDNFILLHGQHTMASVDEQGVHPEYTSLGYLEQIKQKHNKPVGFIDHTSYIWMPACAVAAGANVITKHLCISRAEKGSDWQVCLEPEEMKEAISLARKISNSINTKVKILAPGENIDKSVMRRSIVAARHIPEGKTIEAEDIAYKRPGDGMEPFLSEKVIGKKVIKSIDVDQQILLNDLID